ncbi:MAG: hypothetical protein CVV03_12485 [Firmicutes bacterium HGW-Firmicutes-8]|nr:MAG: hypothetical protein CVV03_12485 [Firmicutes bacterium HGW-Firmicutes-8]
MQMDPHGPITTEGATVEEAIKKALGVLHITREQAKVEILSEGKQGFLGIGSQKARVKVGLLEEEVAERQLTDILGDLQILDEGQEQQYRPGRNEEPIKERGVQRLIMRNLAKKIPAFMAGEENIMRGIY